MAKPVFMVLDECKDTPDEILIPGMLPKVPEMCLKCGSRKYDSASSLGSKTTLRICNNTDCGFVSKHKVV